MDRPKVLATGFLAAVFVAGVAVGGAGSAWAVRNTDSDDAAKKRPTYVERLQTNLGLDETQRLGVEEALRQARVHYLAAVEGCRIIPLDGAVDDGV